MDKNRNQLRDNNCYFFPQISEKEKESIEEDKVIMIIKESIEEDKAIMVIKYSIEEV